MSTQQTKVRVAQIGTPSELRTIQARLREQFEGVEPELLDVDSLVRFDNDRASPCFLPWIRRPHGLAPVGVAFRLALRRGARPRWIDLDGTSGDCRTWFFLAQGWRAALFFVADSVLCGAANLLARFESKSSARAESTTGPLAIVLPVLPDLSHTFIYREAIALHARDPGSRVVVLERGDRSAPDHPESHELLRHAEFVNRDGVMRRAGRVTAWMIRHPRRCARLFASYRNAGSGGLARGLFGKLPLREPRHPGNAFALAAKLAQLPKGPIHVYGSTYSANAALGAGLLLDRACSITSYVDFDFAYDHRMLQYKLESSAFFRVCTGFCRERLRSLAPSMASRLGNTGFDERIPVILFGIPLDHWRPRTDAGPGTGVLFTACRMVPKKGLHLVPPALAALREAGIAVRWRVAGDGEERARLERLVNECGVRDLVTFLGGVANDVVHREILACDLAVLPCVVAADGERDGIPIFLNEAMACGVPVLTTKVSGIPELIEDKVSGFLIEPDDIDALVEKLTAALRDDALRAKVAAGGRSVVVEKLDIDRSAGQLQAAIRSEPVAP